MSGVCYTGPYLDSSGYGEANRNFIKALYEAGVNLKTEKVKFTKSDFEGNPISKLAEELSTRDIAYDYKILHVTPDVYKNYMEKGKYHIGHLFWETSRLPSKWVDACNMMDEIWCGGESNAKAIKDSGVKVPVYVFPQAINTDKPDVKPFRLPSFTGYIFYSIFEWTERKNPKLLLNAFWKEFRTELDVALLIKTHKGSFTAQGVGEILADARSWRAQTGFERVPRTFICTDMLTNEDKWRLHETGDWYVSPHRGEGWAIPPIEATIMGNPIIATKYGGCYDYFSGKHMFIVDHKMVPVDKVYNRYYSPEMEWAEASEKSLREQMRRVYDWSQSDKTKSLPKIRPANAMKVVNYQFTYPSVGAALRTRIYEIDKERASK